MRLRERLITLTIAWQGIENAREGANTVAMGTRVVEMLERAARERGYPDVLTVDNGPELRGRALDGWADDNGVQLYFIDPGKPTQNAYIESFNGRFSPSQGCFASPAGQWKNV